MTNLNRTQTQGESVNDFVADIFSAVIIALTAFLAMVTVIAVA